MTLNDFEGQIQLLKARQLTKSKNILYICRVLNYYGTIRSYICPIASIVSKHFNVFRRHVTLNSLTKATVLRDRWETDTCIVISYNRRLRGNCVCFIELRDFRWTVATLIVILAVRFGMVMRFGNHCNYSLQIEADFYVKFNKIRQLQHDKCHKIIITASF